MDTFHQQLARIPIRVRRDELIETVAASELAKGEINVHAYNCRSARVSAFRVPLPLGRNPILVAGVIGALGLHLHAMQLPFIQSILRVGPVSPAGFGVLLLVALTLLGVMEIFKLVHGRVTE